jgi:uncharacterized repeat protein (TIGR03803 family)
MAKLRIIELSLISSRSETATFAPISRLKSTYVIFFLFCVGLTIAPAQSFTSLLSFDGSNGAFPQGSLVEGTHGKLYGTTPYGGAYGGGTVFEITSNGKVKTLHSFDGTDGGAPYAGLIRSRTGNLYGVTSGSGLRAASGTVFEITPAGKLTTLYIFCSQPNCIDGATPYAGLVEGTNGNFYGMTYRGGTHNGGTIFEVTPEGKLTTLHSFCSEMNCTDGEAPLLASVVQGRNGNFYGTTPMGGAYGLGTVFEITPNGKLTTLHSFDGIDGEIPYAGLMQGSDGHFYGTTLEGGAYHSGTIFEITRKGKLTTLHSFDGIDGGLPYAGLVEGSNGKFYGTTFSGGASSYGGILYETTRKGKLRTLYSFCAESDCVDGRYPVAGLTQEANGNFYGTTFVGGTYGSSDCDPYGNYGCGTLFRLTMEPKVIEH